MQQQHFPVFTVTPRGLMMNGMPLTKSASHNLPPQTLREIAHIETLLKKVKKEEWNNPIPYAGGEYPVLVQASMRAALLSPQPFSLHAPNPLAKAGFNADEARDERGRWTTGGPSFANLKSNYPTYKQYPSKSGEGKKSIWELIDGNVKYNYDHDANFNNSCAIRMSYALNYSGDTIAQDKSGQNRTVSGADDNWYYYRIRDLADYLSQTYGKPDEYAPDTWKNDVGGQTGIVLFKVPFSDAYGHLELFDGKKVLNYDDPDPNAHHDYTDRATNVFFWPVK